jgi:large subunit ribosomal protein L31
VLEIKKCYILFGIKKIIVNLHPEINRSKTKSCRKSIPFLIKKHQDPKQQFIKRFIMKKGIHPENYRLVAFKDMSNDDVFITKSTVDTKETIVHEGVEYPVFKMEISRTSHPFYTGKSKLVDTAGRIDKFKNKYAKFQK